MSLKYPDIIEHSNENLALVDSNYVRGGGKVVTNVSDLYTLSTKVNQLKQYITKVYVVSAAAYYILIDIANVDNSSGWLKENNGQNFANTNLTFNGDRTHNINGYLLWLNGNDTSSNFIATGFYLINFQANTSVVIQAAEGMELIAGASFHIIADNIDLNSRTLIQTNLTIGDTVFSDPANKTGILAIKECSSAPTNTTNIGKLYVESGSLKYISPSGTITTIAAA